MPGLNRDQFLNVKKLDGVIEAKSSFIGFVEVRIQSGRNSRLLKWNQEGHCRESQFLFIGVFLRPFDIYNKGNTNPVSQVRFRWVRSLGQGFIVSKKPMMCNLRLMT